MLYSAKKSPTITIKHMSESQCPVEHDISFLQSLRVLKHIIITSRKIRFPSIISLIVPLEDRKVNAIIEIAKKISSRFKLEYIRDL